MANQLQLRAISLILAWAFWVSRYISSFSSMQYLLYLAMRLP